MKAAVTTAVIGGIAILSVANVDLAWAAEKELGFKFGWQPGTKATLDTTFEKLKEIEGQPRQKLTSAAKFNMRVEKAENDSMAIVFDMKNETPIVSRDGSPMPVQDTLMASLQAMVPTIIVDRGGRFLAIKDAGRIQTAVKKLVSGATNEPLPESIRQFLDNMLSVQTLTAIAGNDWNAMVGFWAGQSLEPGEAYESEGRAPLPLPGSPTVDMLTHITVEGPIPCDGSKGKPLCVRLTTTANPDAAQIKEALEKFMKEAARAAGAAIQVRYKEMDIKTSTILLTEIGTLKPHDYRTEKAIRTTIIAPDSTEQRVSQIERRHTVYSYQ
jgi:hypothetical protein